MMLTIEPPLTFVISLQSLLIAGALSRAVTEREGRALTKPKGAGSTLPALDSYPTNKIKAVGGQDELRKASISSFWKSCPQPSGNQALNKPVSQLEQVEGGWTAGGPRPSQGRGTAATPYTDRGVEIKENTK